MTPSADTLDPLGDRAAVTRWLRERGVVVHDGYDWNPAEIRCRCPWCRHKVKGTGTFSINVNTGLWICFHSDCHDEDGEPRGGSFAKLERKLGGEAVPHNTRPYERSRSRDSSGALVPIAEQLAEAATLLEEGHSYNAVVRMLREEFGVSARTAKNRIADVRKGGAGARRQEALRMAERLREGGVGRRSGRGPASPFLKRSAVQVQSSAQAVEEVESKKASRMRARASAARAPLGEEKWAAPQGDLPLLPRPRDRTLHLAEVAA
jgi:hypothetical protein